MSNNISPLIKNAFSLLEGNLNSSFASHLSELLKDQNIDIHSLWKPSIDMIESERFLVIYVCVPGVSPDKITVEFVNNSINIKGERSFPNINESITNRKQEIIYGNFERKVNIPFSISKSESVDISMENGLMTINIDKLIETNNKFILRPSTK
jgi:HSP20 family molecular chaperone IbpA